MEEQTPTSQSVNTQNPKHVYSYFNFIDPNNPYRIENGNHTSLVLISELLTTENYITWSRAMRRALRAKNKLGFISRSVIRLTDEEDLLFEMWKRCNDMVVFWIQNAVSIDIKHTLAFVDDAQMVWTELKDRFTQQNGPRIFQLRRDLANLRQDRDSYTNARDQIMLIEPLPSINKVFSLIQQQEQHHHLTNNTPSCESMALASKYVNAPFKASSINFTRKERPYYQHCHIQGHTLENCYKAGNVEPPVCSNCNASGHVIEKCYKIHGYPPGHKLYKEKVAGSFANQVDVSTSPNRKEVSEEKLVFTKEQYRHLMNLIQPNSMLNEVPSANQTSVNSTASITPSKMSVRSGLYHLIPKAVSPSALTDLLSCLSPNFPSVAISVKSSINVNDLWHCHLGHISDSRMKLIDDPAVRDNLLVNETSPCCICSLAKQHRLPFPNSSHKSSSIFELVHCDIWGSCSTSAYDGSRYFLTLVDDLSRTT
ncbi:hypothetical protein DKX38_001199 [Salix brachista]|uniref:Retrotransposon Copia-like N-terminal domain-containing protein n=1 Tax=Salix brachista TaxID=2182728 RepID=A0A5N5P2Q7_9ROSI|nr:hypothetical protein DKX38_001199 [Salix brachista]